MCKHCLQGRCPVCQGKHFAWGALEGTYLRDRRPPPPRVILPWAVLGCFVMVDAF